ncbi:hypothetical protein [Streptococcus anginosus]|nr:hypothetical protein [Streptococcus anginosus]
MNELILPVVVGVSTGFVAGVLACVVYAFSKSNCLTNGRKMAP